MAKRKQSEPSFIETDHKAEGGEDTLPSKEAPVSENAAAGSRPTTGWTTGEVTGDTGVSSSSLVVTGEPITEEGHEAEAF